MSVMTHSAADYTLDPASFATIARITHAHAGITLNDGKRQLVYSRLAKQIRKRGLSGFGEFVELMQSDAQVRREAIFALTTNHTKLFRENHHFDHFAQALRPRLIEAAERGRPVRLWSSASSSGEEPYSLAMTLLGDNRAAGARLVQRDVAMLATDLAPHVLSVAKAGRYPGEMAKDVPERYRRVWTTMEGDQMVMAPELKRIIAYRQLNLLDPWPMQGKFDAIFCRNVMIYFDEPTKARLIERFAELLAPGSFLYIGHSERVIGPATDAFEPAGNTIYRRRG
ncbi:protein-glutamate O-methyltransferase CheR [Sphingomonas sp. KR1UV-12]|uniref:Chemotaxis protein methyltransferase n=1 Tax=Sphingomonas aurea TaxID=3063994 RepID=A0ABT9EK16_9SPHN|nr:protein-glutamate O-methyltransferase CheR [Sphingomonas sp. KR1UV-12]MDP1027261.1 protein-glutamate O-methyltransferase CheR [Sphingomonas sp. KR1UV-12]